MVRSIKYPDQTQYGDEDTTRRRKRNRKDLKRPKGRERRDVCVKGKIGFKKEFSGELYLLKVWGYDALKRREKASNKIQHPSLSHGYSPDVMISKQKSFSQNIPSIQ